MHRPSATTVRRCDGTEGNVVPPSMSICLLVAAWALVDARKLVEMAPFKGAILIKQWQAKGVNSNKLVTVPDGTSSKLSALSKARS